MIQRVHRIRVYVKYIGIVNLKFYRFITNR